MGLFLDAAIKWDQLSDTSYDITIGHRHVSKTLHIVFRPIDFDHLSGIHYAKDIDFGLHRREYRGNQEEALCYCKSIFKEHGNDYRRNQTRWTVLKKSKRVKDAKTTLFIHPSFQEKSP